MNILKKTSLREHEADISFVAGAVLGTPFVTASSVQNDNVRCMLCLAAGILCFYFGFIAGKCLELSHWMDPLVLDELPKSDPKR